MRTELRPFTKAEYDDLVKYYGKKRTDDLIRGDEFCKHIFSLKGKIDISQKMKTGKYKIPL
jgi:hypothetical protein